MTEDHQDDQKEEKPDTQTEVDGDRPRKPPPRPTAIGLGDFNFNFRPGQNVICKIVKPEPGGYYVIVYGRNSASLPGFLPSKAQHNIGDEVLATFICIDKNRMLLSERFASGKGEFVGQDWDLAMEGQVKEIATQEADSDQFSSSQKTQTNRLHLRRAMDLIMPPIKPDSARTMRIGDYSLDWLLTQLEGGKQTGCVKATCESRQSLAGMLLYRGRAVGCIYGCESDPIIKPTEESLQSMLSDLEPPDTVVTVYDLPEEITLAMSSLFLGYPVERHDDYSSKDYLDYICNWLGQKHGTATLAISLSQDHGTCLCYIYKGKFADAFHMESQAYRTDRGFVDELLMDDPRAALEVSILPPEMYSGETRFGFSLTSR